MKYTTIIVLSAAVASAQFTINSTTDAITCYGNPNGAYCASDSLGSPIIIRCKNGTGQPGNCDDNTAGQFPFGDIGGSLCWETSTSSGDAACEKNCVVYNDKPFTLPLSVCTPSATMTSSTAYSTTTRTSVYSTSSPLTTSSASSSTLSGSTTITSTGTSSYVTDKTTVWVTYTTTYCPESTTSKSITPFSTFTYYPTNTTSASVETTPTTIYSLPTSIITSTIASGTVSSSAASNGTVTTKSGSAIPVGPTGTTTATPSSYSGAAVSNSAGAGFAVIGLFIAYFL